MVPSRIRFHGARAGTPHFSYNRTFAPLFFAPACSVLGVAQLDSVIIASPPVEDGVHLSLEHLQPYWEELQGVVQSKKIVAIGTSDLDKTQLEQLYQWAQVKDVVTRAFHEEPVFYGLCCDRDIVIARGGHHCGVTVLYVGVLRQALTKTLEKVC